MISTYSILQYLNGEEFVTVKNHDSPHRQIGPTLLAESGGRDLKAAGAGGVGVVRGEVAADKLSGQQTGVKGRKEGVGGE